MRVAVATVCVGVVLDALRRGWLGAWRSPTVPTSTLRAGAPLLIWLVLIAAVVVVQVTMYVSAPREVYPTLSSLAGDVFAFWPVRVGGFTLWSWVGWYLVRR